MGVHSAEWRQGRPVVLLVGLMAFNLFAQLVPNCSAPDSALGTVGISELLNPWLLQPHCWPVHWAVSWAPNGNISCRFWLPCFLSACKFCRLSRQCSSRQWSAGCRSHGSHQVSLMRLPVYADRLPQCSWTLKDHGNTRVVGDATHACTISKCGKSPCKYSGQRWWCREAMGSQVNPD